MGSQDLSIVLLTSPLTQTDTRSNKMPAKDQGFTEDQIEDFKEVFQLFDTKGDGLIQVTQVGEVLRALGTNPTEGEVKKLIQSSARMRRMLVYLLKCSCLCCKTSQANQS